MEIEYFTRGQNSHLITSTFRKHRKLHTYEIHAHTLNLQRN
jgi:hypothetical protein